MKKQRRRTPGRPTETPRGPEILTVAAWAAVLAIGCGASAKIDPAAHSARPGSTDATATHSRDAGPTTRDAGIDAPEPLTLDALAMRGPWLAPGMREVARYEVAHETKLAGDVVRALDHDVCVRVAVTAGVPVHAWLENSAGASLAAMEHADSGLLGTRGPVCVRRGDAIVAHVESPKPTQIRIIAWAAE